MEDGVATLMCITHYGEGKNDNNGQVIEDMLNERNVVCLNNVKKTRIDVRTGKKSVLDLTLVSPQSVSGSI